MTVTALAVLATLAVLALLAAGLWWAARWLRTPGLRRRVLLNLDDGSAVEGTLWARRGPLYVLRSAMLHTPDAEPVAVDGELVVERDRVQFVQVRTDPRR